MRMYDRPGRIGARSSSLSAGSESGGTAVTSRSEPWPDTPRRASFTGRGSAEPRRNAAPRLRNGENLFLRWPEVGIAVPSSSGACSIASPAMTYLSSSAVRGHVERRDDEPHDEPADREHDRRVLEALRDAAVEQDARHDAVPDRVDDDRDHEREEENGYEGERDRRGASSARDGRACGPLAGGDHLRQEDRRHDVDRDEEHEERDVNHRHV